MGKRNEDYFLSHPFIEDASGGEAYYYGRQGEPKYSPQKILSHKIQEEFCFSPSLIPTFAYSWQSSYFPRFSYGLCVLQILFFLYGECFKFNLSYICFYWCPIKLLVHSYLLIQNNKKRADCFAHSALLISFVVAKIKQ